MAQQQQHEYEGTIRQEVREILDDYTPSADIRRALVEEMMGVLVARDPSIRAHDSIHIIEQECERIAEDAFLVIGASAAGSTESLSAHEKERVLALAASAFGSHVNT